MLPGTSAEILDDNSFCHLPGVALATAVTAVSECTNEHQERYLADQRLSCEMRCGCCSCWLVAEEHRRHHEGRCERGLNLPLLLQVGASCHTLVREDVALRRDFAIACYLLSAVCPGCLNTHAMRNNNCAASADQPDIVGWHQQAAECAHHRKWRQRHLQTIAEGPPSWLAPRPVTASAAEALPTSRRLVVAAPRAAAVGAAALPAL